MIPILRPRLPTAQALLPYLERIDAARMYSNHGPLVVELEQRLSDLIAVPGLRVVSAASGTVALVGAVLGTVGRASADRPYALCPSYTYIGTISAIEQCGYIPWFVDIETDTWQISADALLRHPKLQQVGLVMPVAPYGRCVDIEPWERFHRVTGVQVVIDAAAAFEGITEQPEKYLSEKIPVVMSFHATKPFSTGEGGGVVCGLQSEVPIARALNFGIWQSRESKAFGLNGKMSEYHAAVGLASLDAWGPKSMAAVIEYYAGLIEQRSWPAKLHVHPQIASSYLLLDSDHLGLADELEQSGLSYRYWYEQGVHKMVQYQDSLHVDALPNTEQLAARLIGVPNRIEA